MGEVPLHPSLVHLPLGASIIAPLLFAFVIWGLHRKKLGAIAWWAVIGLQAILVIGGFVAMNTGEGEEETVEEVVEHDAIEVHEERAKIFTWTGVGILALAILVPVMGRKPEIQNLLRYVVLAGSVVVLFMGYRVGQAGGELVYIHNAGRAYADPPGMPAGIPSIRSDEEEGED